MADDVSRPNRPLAAPLIPSQVVKGTSGAGGGISRDLEEVATMMGFAFCERCGVPITAFGPSACDRCQSATLPRAKRVQVKKKIRAR